MNGGEACLHSTESWIFGGDIVRVIRGGIVPQLTLEKVEHGEIRVISGLR